MRLTETREVKVPKKVEVGIKCDNCEKIYKTIQREICRMDDNERKFYRVTTGHHDWGNDSVDSVEHYDFCCYKCLHSFFEMYFLKNNSETAYMDVETIVEAVEEDCDE